MCLPHKSNLQNNHDYSHSLLVLQGMGDLWCSIHPIGLVRHYIFVRNSHIYYLSMRNSTWIYNCQFHIVMDHNLNHPDIQHHCHSLPRQLYKSYLCSNPNYAYFDQHHMALRENFMHQSSPGVFFCFLASSGFICWSQQQYHYQHPN